MKITKKNTSAFVRSMLGSNATWALKALVRIFQENQTADERVAEVTCHDNGIGFTGTDAKFLSSLANQYLTSGTLSEKQMNHVFRLMPKYHSQVIAMSDADKLNKLVESAA